MINPELRCSSCGSTVLKRSHSISLRDLPKMALGTYPFRCMDCKARTWINLWSVAKNSGVVCPRCLSAGVYPIDPERLKVGFWGMVRRARGATSYQCRFCSMRFLAKAKKEKPQETTPAGQAQAVNETRPPKMKAAAAAD